MKKFLLAGMFALAASSGAMASGLTGDAFSYQYYYPDLSSAYSGAANGSYVVGSGVEVSNIVDGAGTLDVTDGQVIVDFTGTSWFNGAGYNGFVITGLPISSVTVDSSSTFSGAVISFTGNTLSVNFQGLSFNAGETLVLDINSAVPEAGNLAMMFAGLGLLGVVARRRSAR
jgi:hypothetical protein